MAFVTKQGAHGTLYRFEVEYGDGPRDKADYIGTWRCWAYNEEHAVEKFHDSDEDFDAYSIKRVKSNG